MNFFEVLLKMNLSLGLNVVFFINVEILYIEIHFIEAKYFKKFTRNVSGKENYECIFSKFLNNKKDFFDFEAILLLTDRQNNRAKKIKSTSYDKNHFQ